MRQDKQEARKQRTRNKLRLTSPVGRSVEQRAQYARQASRRKARPATPIVATYGSNRFLALKLEPIPYLEIKPLKYGDVSSLKQLVEETVGPIFQLPDAPDIRYLAAFGAKMDHLVAAAKAEWCITEINDTEPVLVIYYNHGGLGGWLAPRLACLPVLKRRSDRLYRTVLNTFRHMSRQFGMTDITDWCFIEDWADQRLDQDEFETAEERVQFERTILDYRGGRANDYFNLVRCSPAMTVDQCLVDCSRRIPADLQSLMKSVSDVLELIKDGDDPSNYDIAQAGGFTAGFEQYCDNGELSIDMQFGWRWDDDPIGAMAVEYIEDIGNNCGVQPMMSWITIGKEFTFPQTEQDFRNAVDSLTKGSYPDRFNLVLDNLCYEIEQAFPSKYN